MADDARQARDALAAETARLQAKRLADEHTRAHHVPSDD